MKIFIPTKASLNRIHTGKVFDDQQELNWVCHKIEDVPKLAAGGQKDQFLVSNAKNMLEQRQFILDQVQENEWYLSCDDNIRAFIGDDGNTLSKESAWHIITDAIKEADRRGARLVGFAPVDNPFFRKTKYRDVGFCVGKMYAEKKTQGIKPTGRVLVMDDYERTAQHLLHVGKVLVCNALHSKAKHYEEGGLGTWDARLPQKLKDCSQLVEDWFGLYRYKAKAGKDPKSEIQMRFTSREQLEPWRVAIRKRFKEQAA